MRTRPRRSTGCGDRRSIDRGQCCNPQCYSLDPGSRYEFGDKQVATVRRLLVDMIEEYGRHTGQADLLREAVDGRVGEDPPGPPIPFKLPR